MSKTTDAMIGALSAPSKPVPVKTTKPHPTSKAKPRPVAKVVAVKKAARAHKGPKKEVRRMSLAEAAEKALNRQNKPTEVTIKVEVNQKAPWEPQGPAVIIDAPTAKQAVVTEKIVQPVVETRTIVQGVGYDASPKPRPFYQSSSPAPKTTTSDTPPNPSNLGSFGVIGTGFRPNK